MFALSFSCRKQTSSLSSFGAYVVKCSVVGAESKAFEARPSPLPSPPRPDGVSLGHLMNIDMKGLG